MSADNDSLCLNSFKMFQLYNSPSLGFYYNNFIMALKISVYDADQTNVNRLWDIEANRTSHLKNLGTIYKERQAIRTKSEKDHIKRLKQLQQFQMSKLKNFNNRNKSFQDKINYENALLRNKILEAYENRSSKQKSRSVFLAQTEKPSPFQVNKAVQIYRSNLKIGQKLSSIKSELIENYHLKQHSEKSKQFSEMIAKKSPQKKAYLKSLTKKKFFLLDVQESASLFH